MPPTYVILTSKPGQFRTEPGDGVRPAKGRHELGQLADLKANAAGRDGNRRVKI